MRLLISNLVVGLVLAYGGIQEVVVRGILGGERDALLVGLAGTITSLLLAVSGFALWRGWRGARGLTFLACALVAVFCFLAAALPPHFVGVFVMLLGVSYSAAVSAYLVGRGHRVANAT